MGPLFLPVSSVTNYQRRQKLKIANASSALWQKPEIDSNSLVPFGIVLLGLLNNSRVECEDVITELQRARP
jgi:hypothetical protein